MSELAASFGLGTFKDTPTGMRRAPVWSRERHTLPCFPGRTTPAIAPTRSGSGAISCAERVRINGSRRHAPAALAFLGEGGSAARSRSAAVLEEAIW